MFEYFLAID